MSDYEVKAEFQDNYRYAHDYWAPYTEDARVYSLAASGYTWSQEERQMLSDEGREPIEFNIMRRPLEFYSGYLRDNLNSIVYAPVEGSDVETAKQFTQLSYYIWDKGGGYTTFLGSCDEMFKAGMSLCGIQMDYSKDFINGDISFFNRTYNSFYLDPTFSKLDLSDCGFAITRDLLGPSSIKQLLPFIDPKIIDDLPNSFRDDKFNNYHPQFTTIARNRKIIAYDQYYRRTSRMRTFLVDLKSDFYRDITDLEKDEVDKLKFGMERLRKAREESQQMGIDVSDMPQVEIQKAERPYIELNIMLNGECVYQGENDTGITEMYPFVPNVCYFEPSIWMPSQRVQGLASCEYSNQRQFNKRHMKIQDMFDSVISTGYMYLLGSVPDVSDMQQSGQNKLIGVDPDNAPQGLDSVRELQGGNVPPALIEYQKILDELSLTLANVSESLLGIDEGGNTQVSGRLAQVRVANGLRSNRKVFDNIETAQQILGTLVLKCIQNKYSPGKVERILGEQPSQQFYENTFEQYDAVVKEGVRSKSQKDAYYYELVNLKREGIVDVPQAEIIRALQMSGIDDLQEAIEKQQQEQAEQQKKIDEQEKVALELANAKTEEALALAQSRRARVLGEIGLMEERSSEATENLASAALDRARTITEIAKMEDDRIIRVLEFVNMLESQEREDRERVSQKIFDRADQINSETQGSSENMQKTALQQLEMPIQQPSEQL